MLDDWQQDFLDATLGELDGGLWAALVAAILASRRNGKNYAVYAREMYGLGVLGEHIIHTAQLFKTTKESYNDLLGFIEAGPLGELLTHKVASPGTGYTMWFSNGGRIDFIARSKSSGRGLNADLLILDESQDLNDDELGALVPTQAARPNPQTWYLGSAPGPDAVVWQRMRKTGREGSDPKFAYFEFSADPDADIDDLDAWRMANPALVSGRLNMRVIESERNQMSPEMFARERLSISPEIIDAAGAIAKADWSSCSLPADGVSPGVFTVSVAPDQSWSCIGSAGRGPNGLVHVGVVGYERGTAWLAPRLLELAAKWNVPMVVNPGSPVGSVTAAGLPVVEASSRELMQWCSSFLDGVGGRTVAHLNQPELNVSVANGVRQDRGDGWIWSSRKSSVEISPLWAVTMAHGYLISAPETPVFVGGFVDLDDYLDDE